jgi:GT2 family glycosyltransferase
VSFVPSDAGAAVDIQVVAFGDTSRLRACLASLTTHEAIADFSITVVLNPRESDSPRTPEFAAGIAVIRPTFNLGWAGGLHAARAATSARYLVWAQDDMVVSPGWLDALVETADAFPTAGAIGSVEVDPVTLEPNGVAGGYAVPPDEIGRWNDNEAVGPGYDVDGTRFDWITSKGMLTRAAAWDEVRGTDPRLFPLNHVDKDYSTHLRSHGWDILVAPSARLIHEGHQSAPRALREFLPPWQEPRLNARWGRVAALLPHGRAEPVPHECNAWSVGDLAAVERLVAREATRMLVPLSDFFAAREKDLRNQLAASENVRLDVASELDRTRGHYAEREGELARLFAAYRAQTAELEETQVAYREREAELREALGLPKSAPPRSRSWLFGRRRPG